MFFCRSSTELAWGGVQIQASLEPSEFHNATCFFRGLESPQRHTINTVQTWICSVGSAQVKKTCWNLPSTAQHKTLEGWFGQVVSSAISNMSPVTATGPCVSVLQCSLMSLVFSWASQILTWYPSSQTRCHTRYSSFVFCRALRLGQHPGNHSTQGLWRVFQVENLSSPSCPMDFLKNTTGNEISASLCDFDFPTWDYSDWTIAPAQSAPQSPLCKMSLRDFVRELLEFSAAESCVWSCVCTIVASCCQSAEPKTTS